MCRARTVLWQWRPWYALPQSLTGRSRPETSSSEENAQGWHWSLQLGEEKAARILTIVLVFIITSPLFSIYRPKNSWLLVLFLLSDLKLLYIVFKFHNPQRTRVILQLAVLALVKISVYAFIYLLSEIELFSFPELLLVVFFAICYNILVIESEFFAELSWLLAALVGFFFRNLMLVRDSC